MKIYAITRDYEVLMRETVYVTGENEEDAYDNALAGKIWDYANDGDEIEWYNFTYKQETIEDTGEVTGE
jgi:hypothetical protein